MCGGGSPNNTTSTVINQQQLPGWYQNYLQTLIGRAMGESAGEAPTYGGPRIQGLSNLQHQAISDVANQQGQWHPYRGAAQNYYANAAQPNAYTTSAAQLAQAASNNQLFSEGAKIIGSGLGDVDRALDYASNISAAQAPYFDEATGLLKSGAKANIASMASPYMQQAFSQSGTGSAMPWLMRASRSLPQETMNNMNPYISGAMNQLGVQAANDLQTKFLPAVRDDFIKAGQFGSTRQQDITAQTISDLQRNLLAQQSGMLAQGYGQAGQLAQQNLGLQGQLAQTAGQLGNQQQQNLLSGAQLAGNLGAQEAGLRLQGANTAAGLGTAASQALAQQAQYGLQGAGLRGQLGSQIAGIGATQGGLQMQGANTMAGLSNAYTQSQLGAGQGMMGLGIAGQQLGLQDANALFSSGAQQQNLGQRSLDTAYQDWLNQTYYPQNQTSWLSNIVRGLPSTGIGQVTQTQTPTNPGAQIGGLLTAGIGMMGGYGTGGGGAGGYGGYYRRGGMVKRFKAGGRVAYQHGGKAACRGIGGLKMVA